MNLEHREQVFEEKINKFFFSFEAFSLYVKQSFIEVSY